MYHVRGSFELSVIGAFTSNHWMPDQTYQSYVFTTSALCVWAFWDCFVHFVYFNQIIVILNTSERSDHFLCLCRSIVPLLTSASVSVSCHGSRWEYARC